MASGAVAGKNEIALQDRTRIYAAGKRDEARDRGKGEHDGERRLPPCGCTHRYSA